MLKKPVFIILLALSIALVVFLFVNYKMSEPASLHVDFPKNTGTSYTAANTTPGCGLTLLLINSTIYYYNGDSLNNLHKTFYGPGGVSDVLERTAKICDTTMVVIIKPTAEATYKNTVDILDLMTVYKITRYSLSAPTKNEITSIKNHI